MMRVARRLSGAGCTAAVVLFAASSGADPVPEAATLLGQSDPPQAMIAQRGSISLQQATEMARRQHQGRVVRAETVARGGRLVHEIRILGDDGRVRTVRIDAETGQMQ